MMQRRKGEESKILNLKSKITRHRPKLGQHFLQDQGYRNKILEALPLEAGDVVIEIGPGRGAMTALLAGRARRVIAIELDRALAQGLQEEFPEESRVQIIPADVLRVDFAALCGQEGVQQAFVFGNLPYYITSPILHHLFAQWRSIRSMGLLMQREVAERLTAAPGTRDYGYLTIATQICSHPEIALTVPPGAFSPAPKVQSSLVIFQMKAKYNQWPQEKCDKFLEFAKRCFAKKRKNLLNNLGGSYLRTRLLEAFEAAGKSPNLRAEQLSLEELAGIFERLTRAPRRDYTGI
ncbi:MAG TPA: 16S rRNA (adenine(1518)-N(6)/adenine(1519)-N(6))-dimethyltransferase RsmA [Terriglobia bacterium]|nr:16S rRNA (adenine(1518)-N(6)/adenine(1519)-N(6))-dimethyltransferase RsmA [Terriglobia bacterium]